MSDEPRQTQGTPGPSEFDRFRDLVKKVVNVPKEDVDKEAEREKQEKADKRKAA